MDSEARREQILLYVAGQLDPAEEESVRAYLAGRGVFAAAALAEAEQTVRKMLRGVAPATPNATLRDKLMTRVAATSTTSAQRSMIWPAMTSLAAALAIAGGVLFTIERNARRAERQQLAMLNETLDAKARTASIESDSLKTALAQMQLSSEVLQAENLKLVSLGGKETSAGGRIFWDRTHNRWTVSVFKLQPLPPDKVYELWFIDKQGHPLAAGAIEVDPKGSGIVNIALPPNVEIAAAGITSESRASNMSAPTPPIHLSGAVEQ